MPLFPDISNVFQMKALRPDGSNVEGALVRILNANGDDVTVILFGIPEPKTDGFGIAFAIFYNGPGLPLGQTYTIQVIATGFKQWSTQTDTAWYGKGSFIANLEPIDTIPEGSYTITEPANKPLSSMAPIVCSVSSPNTYEYEYINAMVTHPDGSSTTIQAPVDSTDLATIDIRNRVQLGIRPLLVPDGSETRPDSDFSTVIDVTFSSVHPEGETAIPGSFERLIAHSLPPDGKTDLGDYTSLNNQLWMVPPGPVIIFRGYYRDVMFWLPETVEGGTYTLKTEYFDSANVSKSTVNSVLTESKYVQRLRLNSNPDPTYSKAILTIMDGSSPITLPLTVIFRD